MFATRAAAGRALAAALKPDSDRELQVLALSREAIAVAVHVAAACGADLEMMCARFSAVSIVIEGSRPQVELNRVIELGLHAADVNADIAELQAQIARAASLFRGYRPFPSVYDRHVVLVDDGLTPMRAIAAAAKHLRTLHVGRLTIALPAASKATSTALATVADDVICLEESDRRGAEFSYADADPVGDIEALTLLGRSRLAAARVRISRTETWRT